MVEELHSTSDCVMVSGQFLSAVLHHHHQKLEDDIPSKENHPYLSDDHSTKSNIGVQVY